MISQNRILVGIFVTALLLAGVFVTSAESNHQVRTSTGQQQDPNFLDLTAYDSAEDRPQRTGGGVASSVGGADILKAAPLGVILQRLDRRNYHFGEQVIYEVTLQNISKDVLTIPWSPDLNRLGLNGQFNQPGYTEASLSLVAEDEIAGPQFIDSQRIFGAPGVSSSLKKLRPGESIRIRAAGSWQFTDSSVARRVFAKSLYTVKVRAYFRLEGSSSSPNYRTAISTNSQTVVLRKPQDN